MFNVQSQQFGRKTDYLMFFKDMKNPPNSKDPLHAPSPQVSGDGFLNKPW